MKENGVNTNELHRTERKLGRFVSPEFLSVGDLSVKENKSNSFSFTDDVIAKKYKIENKIGEGKFGIVFYGFHQRTKEHVAIKMEYSISPAKLLKNEVSIMKYLYDHGCRNIPIVHWYGLYKDSLCLVMSFYDCSLHDYILNKDLPLNKITSIMIYAITILESIHKNYVLHRDIKPQNFMLKEGHLYIIDFGLSTFYIDDKTEHLPDLGPVNEDILGTPKYVSYNMHEGYSLSRRDDLISLGYMYLYLQYRVLPWDKLSNCNSLGEINHETHIMHHKNKERRELKKIENIIDFYQKKMNTESKTEINYSTNNIVDFLDYCYKLNYKDEPKYDLIKELFSKQEPEF